MSPAPVGTRVRLRPHVEGPEARSGTIVETFGFRGARVRHDEPAWELFGVFGVKDDFNWTWGELELEDAA